MALNYPPFVVLMSHFRITGGHDLNPSAATLTGEDQQLFATFNQLAVQVMTGAGLAPDLRPLVVTLASMSPGVSPVQRVQLATLFVRNALAALNQPVPALGSVMLTAAAARSRTPAAKRKRAAAPKTASARTRKPRRRPGR